MLWIALLTFPLGFAAPTSAPRKHHYNRSPYTIIKDNKIGTPCTTNVFCGSGKWCGGPVHGGYWDPSWRSGWVCQGSAQTECAEDAAAEGVCPEKKVQWQTIKMRTTCGQTLRTHYYRGREYRFENLTDAKQLCDEFGSECSGVFDPQCTQEEHKTPPEYFALCDSELYNEAPGGCVIPKDEPPVHWGEERLATSCFRNFVKKRSGKDYRFQHLADAKKKCDKLPECSGVYDHRCLDPSIEQEDPAYYALCNLAPFTSSRVGSCVIPKSPWVTEKEVKKLELETKEEKEEYDLEIAKFELEAIEADSCEKRSTGEGWAIGLIVTLILAALGFAGYLFYKKKQSDPYVELEGMSSYAPPSALD